MIQQGVSEVMGENKMVRRRSTAEVPLFVQQIKKSNKKKKRKKGWYRNLRNSLVEFAFVL